LRISIIIPTLNEAAHLPALLQYLYMLPGVTEIIVCDGGSEDATIKLAQAGGAVVVTAPRNRGAQLNAGARAASSEILWFLHADARPHRQSTRYILRACRDSRSAGGNFRLSFASPVWPARVIESISRVQRRCGIYYGDSGIFVRREVFETLGGYRDWPLFEDYDFARRLERNTRRHHGRTVYLPLPLIVSARRLQRGPWRTLLLWTFLQAMFSLGVAPQRLVKFYHRKARSK
jgi:rSAM/selenodomain-associated transferase 2